MSALPEHDHCLNCGEVVPFDMRYCCMDCYNAHQAKLKKWRNRELFFWIGSALTVVAILIVAVLI